MNFFHFFLVFSFLQICCSYQRIKELRKQINDGEILGRYITSEFGRTIHAFIGIPFAAPPVGDLRFRAPQKVTPWKDILLTQQQRPKCPQIDTISLSTVVQGEEDCLYLNVYVPEKSTNDKLAVLVWFYGGAFVFGHGGPTTYGPDYLLDHDVILVAGNYRLNVLGFLSTEDRNCPGNFGLKDQAFLLQWVQDNIEHFGGDKNSVTIWGESAGATSVAYHMISQMSSGLFHRGISHSGGLYGPARSGVARQLAITLAQRMNCPILNDSRAIIECLRQVPPEEMIYASAAFPIVIESFESDEPAFIDERNFNNRFSNFAEIPWLLGMNSEESLNRIGGILDNSESFGNLIANWVTSLANFLEYNHLDATAQETITKHINEFYLGSEAGPNNQVDKQIVLNVFTDRYLLIAETIEKRLEDSNHKNTYLYLFTHRGKASYSTASRYYGTSHIDDLIPLFPFHKTAFYSSIPTKQDRELTKVMTLMWTNFARFGNPTPDGSEIPIWPAVTNGTFANMQYMQIGNENGQLESEILIPKEDYYSARAEFWKKLRVDFNLNSWFDD